MSSGARKRCSATSAAPIVSSSITREPGCQSSPPASSSRIPIHVSSEPTNDCEEDDGEGGEDTSGNRTIGLLEREGKEDGNRRRERAEADEGGVAVVLAEDPEQRAGRREHDEAADVNESARARPAWS